MRASLSDLAARGLGRLSSGVGRAAEGLAGGARSARFLQGLLQFETRPDDVFISSYPRSGTTWLQQILVVLTRGGDPGGVHIAEHAPWFERSLALGTRDAASFATLPSPRVFKSHLPHAWLPQGARYVYARRDGRDVAVSYFHLYRSHLGFDGDFGQFLSLFLRGRLQYRSWFKHVAGWEALRHRPDVRIVDYAELERDLVGTMVRLSEFLDLPHDRAQVEQLSAQCTFAYMKARQDHFDHATEEAALRGMQRGQFVRRGGSGGHADYFDADTQRRFEAAWQTPQRLARLEWDLPAFLH